MHISYVNLIRCIHRNEKRDRESILKINSNTNVCIPFTHIILYLVLELEILFYYQFENRKCKYSESSHSKSHHKKQSLKTLALNMFLREIISQISNERIRTYYS